MPAAAAASGRGRREGACSRCAPTRTTNTELAEKTWHCCGQAGTFAIQLRLKFLLSFVRFCDMEKRLKVTVKLKPINTQISRVELRVAFASSSVSMAPGKGSVPKGNTSICVCMYQVYAA